MKELTLAKVFDIAAHIEILRYTITTDKLVYEFSQLAYMRNLNDMYDVVHIIDTTARYILVMIAKDQELTLRGDA